MSRLLSQAYLNFFHSKEQEANKGKSSRDSQETARSPAQNPSWHTLTLPLSGAPHSPASLLSTSGSPGPAAAPPPGCGLPPRPGWTELPLRAEEAVVGTENEGSAQAGLLPCLCPATYRQVLLGQQQEGTGRPCCQVLLSSAQDPEQGGLQGTEAQGDRRRTWEGEDRANFRRRPASEQRAGRGYPLLRPLPIPHLLSHLQADTG